MVIAAAITNMSSPRAESADTSRFIRFVSGEVGEVGGHLDPLLTAGQPESPLSKLSERGRVAGSECPSAEGGGDSSSIPLSLRSHRGAAYDSKY